MPEYRVEWYVEVEADDRQEAARLALAIQQSGDRSLSGVFNVWGRMIPTIRHSSTLTRTPGPPNSRGAHRSRPIAGDLTCPRSR